MHRVVIDAAEPGGPGTDRDVVAGASSRRAMLDPDVMVDDGDSHVSGAVRSRGVVFSSLKNCGATAEKKT